MSDAVHKASDAVISAAVDDAHLAVVSSAFIKDFGTADAGNSMDLSALLSDKATAPLYSSKRNKPIVRTSHRKARDMAEVSDREWEHMVFSDVPDWIESTPVAETPENDLSSLSHHQTQNPSWRSNQSFNFTSDGPACPSNSQRVFHMPQNASSHSDIFPFNTTHDAFTFSNHSTSSAPFTFSAASASPAGTTATTKETSTSHLSKTAKRKVAKTGTAPTKYANVVRDISAKAALEEEEH